MSWPHHDIAACVSRLSKPRRSPQDPPSLLLLGKKNKNNANNAKKCRGEEKEEKEKGGGRRRQACHAARPRNVGVVRNRLIPAEVFARRSDPPPPGGCPLYIVHWAEKSSNTKMFTRNVLISSTQSHTHPYQRPSATWRAGIAAPQSDHLVLVPIHIYVAFRNQLPLSPFFEKKKKKKFFLLCFHGKTLRPWKGEAR